MPDFSPESVAFVTGAASGIGLAVARQLILDGIRNIALIDLSAETLSAAAISFSSIPASQASDIKVLQIPTDVSKESDVDAAVKQTVDAFGRIDVCFNAAGISGGQGAIADIGPEELDRILSVNLRGLWLCERAQIKQFLKQEMRDVSTGLPLKTRGSIVNVGSLTSHFAIPHLSPYIMSKHGVLGLTKADAMDYAKEGIRVNCLCPGWIRTGMTKSLQEGEGAALGDKWITRAPSERWGLPEEVAYMASFLLSDKASFVTGAAINVDGGYGAC